MVMEETLKQRGKEVENEDTSTTSKERAISPFDLGMSKRTMIL